MGNESKQTHTWPTWWGSAVQSDEPPAIGQLLLDVRKDIGGLEAKKGGAAFPVKSAKELMIKLRTSLDKHKASCWVVGQDVKNIELDRGTACMVQSKVRLAASDGSFVDFVGVGHGADTQDKAAGKASTYAWKDALCKGLDLPDAEMVDTDDTGEPVPGGVTKAKGKTKMHEDTGGSYRAELAKCKNADEVRSLMTEWRQTLPPDIAVQVAPMAKARIAELS